MTVDVWNLGASVPDNTNRTKQTAMKHFEMKK